MQDDELLSFNFWPAFADMILALVLMLCLAVFLVAATLTLGTVDLKQVEANQMSIIDAIAGEYNLRYRPVGQDTYGIFFGDGNDPDIAFHNDLNSQRITFSGLLLFGPNQTSFSPEGATVLRRVGAKLHQQLPLIREIQIQGHADNKPTTHPFASNLDLAAMRAIAVFTFLQDVVGIDPSLHLMSATSFGEYHPVQRIEGERYDMHRLAEDNSTPEQRSRNRRIELVVFYRR